MVSVKTAGDFMRRKLIVLGTDTNVIDGVTRLLKDNISGAPVVDGERRYLGVFSEKCCMNALTESVEAAREAGATIECARDFMTSKLVTLSAQIDVFEAIDHILSKRISGAPVLGEGGRFEGIFSEKTAMQVLIAAAYDQFPGSSVGAFMNTDRNRIIAEDDSLLDVAHKFQLTAYRRLPVLRNENLQGQVSRRDVLRAEHKLTKDFLQRNKNDDSRLRKAATATVGDYMDCEARTITTSLDLLGVAQIFLNSPYRRLPVVEDGVLVGQVSRRDLLSAAADLLRPKRASSQDRSLYISTLSDERPPSLK